MGPLIKVQMPGGMEQVLESLTRAILKDQPNNIYRFAVEHIQTLLKEREAQSSGLSQSPTEETADQKVFTEIDGTKQDESKLSVSATEEQKTTEEPESNDTSYGVEATAVRTLAASTGTVAILGTTAKVLESSESVLDELSSESRLKDNPSISVTTADAEIEGPNVLEQTKTDEEINESHKTTQETINFENNVEQQKETKQIENEALQGRISDPQSGLTSPKTSPEPFPDEKKTEKLNEPSPSDISSNEPSPEQSNVPEYVEIPKDESQLPKIVDVQEKKTARVPQTSDKSDNNDVSLFKEAVEKETVSVEQTAKETKEPSPTEIAIPTLSEEEIKMPSDSETGSPDISKTEEDNEISSERLKTNSLSDMSLSEALNSEGEEAAREAAKAQELQEMVASLSASANESAFQYKMALSEASNSNENAVGTSSRKSVELEPKTHETIMEEKISPETNGEDDILSDLSTQLEITGFEIEDSPSETSEPQSNESNESSKRTEESKISDREEKESPKYKKIKDSPIDNNELEDSKIHEEIEPTESNIAQNVNEEEKTIAAATTIQSSFRGYKVRKDLKIGQNGDNLVSEIEGEIKDQGNETTLNDEEKESILQHCEEIPEETRNENQEISQKIPKDHQGNEILDREINESQPSNTVDSYVANAPESLIRIAQAEVDRICVEAERTTETLMTPPPTIDTDTLETDYQDDNEDFPAPPDDLLDMNGKNEITKDEQDSSATEPTIPLGTNTEGDSSKTEDTTAPSFADSEIKSQHPMPSQKIDDAKQESSLTDNINTEVAVNRDSTDGELTMEEDSKEDDIGSVMLTAKEPDEEKSDNNVEVLQGVDEEKAATVIQANYRGFKTRQDLKKETVKAIVPSETDPGPISLIKDKITSEPSGQKQTSDEKDQNQPDEKPKRPDQIDVLPRTEDISLIQGEDISPAQDSPSDSKDDTSSTTLSEEELNEKARKIQAGVRGYLVRKEQKVKRDAAVKIQSTFRGFKTRQRLKQDDIANVEITKTS